MEFINSMMKRPDSHVWYFCRNQWVSRIKCRHCEDCDICYDDAWHCISCGKCKVGHWLKCDGCGGKSLTGVTYGVLEGDTTEDARTAPGELSLGRPKKRSRHVDSDNGLGAISELSHLQSLFVFDTTDIFTMQTKLEAPKDIQTRPCDCKDLCSTRRCLCRRWGGSCKHNCKCSGCKDDPPLGCQNPFRYSEYRYFGPSLPGQSVPRATPCFTDYVEKALKTGNRPLSRNNSARVSVETLEKTLMADRDSMDMWDDLTELHDTLETLAVDSEERKAHLWRIFQEGLSVEAESCFFYSFCEKNWEYVLDYTHCATCNKCYSVRSSWHCGVCRKCCHNGAYEPCHRCGGTSTSAGIRLAESQPGTQSNNRLRITGSVSELLDESSSAMDEEVTPRPEADCSSVRSLPDEESLIAISRLGAQSTGRLPAVGRRAELLNSTSNATTAVPASLTLSNLSRHTHRSVQESLQYPQEATSQYSDGLQSHEQCTKETVTASTEEQTTSGCDCSSTDGCRSSKCPCAASGRLCSKRCTSLYGHRLCWNAQHIMKNSELGAYYSGSLVQVEFHDCFKTRLEAVASGELSMDEIEDTSGQFSYGLISGRELSLMKELPIGSLEDSLWSRRDIPDGPRTPVGHPFVQRLFRLALSKNYLDDHCWKFSLCEGKWIKFAEWVHCVKCRRCHTIQGAVERCWE
jgi:hypothetical protein